MDYTLNASLFSVFYQAYPFVKHENLILFFNAIEISNYIKYCDINKPTPINIEYAFSTYRFSFSAHAFF